jgi:hypothetical protein
MTELNVRIASTREAPTAGDNAHTTYGRRKTTERALLHTQTLSFGFEDVGERFQSHSCNASTMPPVQTYAPYSGRFATLFHFRA